MDLSKAREIIRTLANGVDPTTGEVFAADSVYNHPDVIRALFTVWMATSPQKPDPERNAGKPWTELEEDKLRDEFAQKMNISEIAKEHGRTKGAIESRLERMGLKKKRPIWRFWK